MRRLVNKWTILVVALVIVGLWAINVQDWHQLWTISSAPDNIPIVAMLFLVPFFTWMGVSQAIKNDRLIGKLESDSKLAKTHHRKVEPWRPGWARELHVWPYLVRIEFLATVIVTVVLFIDRKSTRLNSSHGYISYAVFCLQKKNGSTLCGAVTRSTGRRYTRTHTAGHH